MGKVTKMLEKIKDTDHLKLFERFKHIISAKAIREYIGTKEDKILSLEVNLTGEEIIRRMHLDKPYIKVKLKKDNKS